MLKVQADPDSRSIENTLLWSLRMSRICLSLVSHHCVNTKRVKLISHLKWSSPGSSAWTERVVKGGQTVPAAQGLPTAVNLFGLVTYVFSFSGCDSENKFIKSRNNQIKQFECKSVRQNPSKQNCFIFENL